MRTALAAAALLLIIAGLSAHYLRLSLCRVSDERADLLLRRTPDELMRCRAMTASALKLSHERVEICSHDGLRLRGLLFPADSETGSCVICVHGYRSAGLRDHASTLMEYHRRGFNVLVPDDRAHGDSEGRYIGFGWLDRIDLVGWCDHLTQRYKDCKIVFHGVSMGGAAVICAGAESPPSLAAVIADCPYTSGYEEFRHVTKNYLHVPEFPLLETTALLARVVCGYSLRKCSPLDAVSRMRVPLLLIHGGSDDFVPTEMSRRIYAACPSKKSLLIIPGAPHGTSSAVNPKLYWGKIDDFLAKYSICL